MLAVMGVMIGGSGSYGRAIIRALLGDGIAAMGTYASVQLLASGDTFTIDFANVFDSTIGSDVIRLCDGDSGAGDRVMITQIGDGTITFVGNFTLTLDEVAVVSGVTVFPIDALNHRFVGTMTGAGRLYRVLANWNALDKFGRMAAIFISTTTVARSFESWTFNNLSLTEIPNDQGTGASINLSGVGAEDWTTVPLS